MRAETHGGIIISVWVLFRDSSGARGIGGVSPVGFGSMHLGEVPSSSTLLREESIGQEHEDVMMREAVRLEGPLKLPDVGRGISGKGT